MQIRIKSIPPGEAPEHIRQAWIGLVIPVPSRFVGRWKGLAFGVLSGPKSNVVSWFAALIGFGQRKVGYVVESRVAIDLLAARSQEAADWWRHNASQFTKSGRYFVFAAESCEEIP
ncbi:MAG TPA: hypothetical protein VGR14_11695 [Verrucomicrobiae bacterium]|nr:hypothetical protein [Verrucomicrobiae bacterium]